MTLQVLLSQTGVVGPGPSINVPTSNNVRVFQVNPQINVGFTGTLIIEGSNSAQPGNNDWIVLATIIHNVHSSNYSLEVKANVPWVRARLSASSLGSIAVYGDSRQGDLTGGSGSGSPYTAVVSSVYTCAVSGNNIKINAPVVPSFTTDDVVYSDNINQTLTTVLNNKQDKIGNGSVTANQNDINTLTGAAAYGLSSSDIQKLADVNASATEINHTTGATSNIQTQLNTLSSSKAIGPGVNLTGLTASVSSINSFFNTPLTVSVSVLNNLTGLTVDAAILNQLAGTSGQFAPSDLIKLGDITASATEINSLSGFTGTSTNLNKLVGLTSSTADLNAIVGLAGTGVTATQLAYLSGLSQNVQTALSGIPSLTGLTSSVNDINLLTGAFAGTGAYSAALTSAEFSYLSGVTSNIQTQLNAKRSTSVSIGIAEISGASITITELNYLQGATSNIQAQITALSAAAITGTGGTFTGPISLASGTAGAPSLRFASATTSGLYLFGGSGVGITISGTRFISMDGTDFSVGNAATGAPLLKGSGFGASTPGFAFVNDTDTGMYRIGANSVGFAAGASNMLTLDQGAAKVTVGGATASNFAVEVSGIFKGEKLLATSATLDAGTSTGATGATTLYTVPTGRTCIITKIYVVLTSVVNLSDDSLFRMNIGLSPSYDELVDNTNNVTIFNPAGYNFTTAGQVMPLGVGANTFPAVSGSSGADYQIFAAGSAIKANIATQAGADTFAFKIFLFGFEY